MKFPNMATVRGRERGLPRTKPARERVTNHGAPRMANWNRHQGVFQR